ncbi:MAG: hypothetical protein J2P57_22095 [Acidimicrobiaceae bacterium]|nr:hypothetical protein [Acidimicrobiaceae bacterium]
MSQEDTIAASAAGFCVRLPPSWWDLPLEPDDRQQRIDELVRGTHPDLDQHQRARLTSVLVGLADMAARCGALQCAGSVMIDDTKTAVMAGLTVTVIDVPQGDDDALSYLLAIVLTGSRSRSSLPDDCALAVLPRAGQALRIREGAQAKRGDPEPEALVPLDLRYFVRIPGDARAVVLAFHSPDVARQETGDELVRLFDAMAATFCFVDAQGEPLPPPPES